MMQMAKTGLLLAAAAVCAVSSRGIEVVKEGAPRAAIVVSPMAAPSERLAAEELAGYVKKMSGAELPVYTEMPGNRLHHDPRVRRELAFDWILNPDKPHASTWEMMPESQERLKARNAVGAIVIGSLDSLSTIPKSVRTKLEACDKDEAFLIKSEGGHVYVIGKKPIGALYGTYTLLETLGVRWFHPGVLGEHVPHSAAVSLPDELNNFQKPDMVFRYQRGGTGPYDAYEVNLWAARNKMQIASTPALRWLEVGRCTPERARFLNEALNARGPSRGGHMIWDQTVPDELFAGHPEYYPLKDGERKVGGGAGGFQRCVSNPEVLQRVVRAAVEWCGADPKNQFTFDAADSRETWCACEHCRAMGTVDGSFTIATMYHRFASCAVKGILDRLPEARLGVMFYIDKAYPPADKTIRYDGPNVHGIYCTCWPYARCYAHALTDPDCEPNRKCLANMLEILKVCPRLYTFEYLCNANIEYVPVWKTTTQDIKDMARAGYLGYMDIVHGYKWRARWLSLYLGAKLQWNTSLDPDALRADAYAGYYGAAAPAMTRYHDLRLKLWDSAPGHAFYGGPKRNAYCLTVPGAETELRAHLAEARTLAKADPRVLERIALDEQYLDEFWKAPADILAERFSAEKQVLPQRVAANSPITVDGELSEAAWLSARPVSGFLRLKTGLEPTQDSSFRVAYDEANLYIGFVAMNDKAWGPPVAEMKARDDSKIWGDCHIELQFAPPDGGGRFFHICVNTEGQLYDAAMVGADIDRTYDSQAEVKVRKLDDRFVYELRLPLAPMAGDVSPGKVWGIYALRAAHNLQPPETKEASALDGNYPHRVLEFRQAVFGENVVENGNFSDRDEKKKNPAD